MSERVPIDLRTDSEIHLNGFRKVSEFGGEGEKVATLGSFLFFSCWRRQHRLRLAPSLGIWPVGFARSIDFLVF